MSIGERTGNPPAPEPPSPLPPSRWAARARRVRNEAGLYLIRGTATAIGGAIVAYGSIWLQAR